MGIGVFKYLHARPKRNIMNREIKFRGKRINNSEWVIGDLLKDGSKIFITNLTGASRNYYEVIPETVGQFTGLKDKNDVDIYEGDYDADFQVIMWCENRNGWASKTYDFPTKEIICCHCYRCEGDYDIQEIDNIEIIGNIHDNPELTK